MTRRALLVAEALGVAAPRLSWLPIGLLAVLAIWLIVSPMLAAWFGAIDDHEIARIVGPDRHLDLSEVAPSIETSIAADSNRFRPLRWVFRVLEAYVWGWRAQGWYLDRLVLAAVTAVVTGIFAVRYVPAAVAALAGLLVIVGLQAEIWYRLGPQETYAVPLYMGGLAMIAYRRPAAGLILVVLAALTKEAFVPVALLAVGWVWLLGYRREPAIAGVLILAIGLSVVSVLTSRGEPFGQVRNSEAVRLELDWMLDEAAAVMAWPLFAAILLVLSPRLGGILLMLAAAIFVPQAVLDADLRAWRYLLPASLGAILVVAAGLAVVTARWARAGLAATYVAALMTMPALLTQARAANQAAADTRAFQTSTIALESALMSHPGAVLVVRPSDLWDFEPLFGLRAFVPIPHAVFLPPPKRLVPPMSEAIQEVLAQASAHGGLGYDPWFEPASCVEADFHVAAVPPICDVVVLITGWPIP